MRQHPDGQLYSASDLVNFLGCGHATALDVRQLTDPVDFPPDSAQTVLLQEKGIEHERAFLEQLRAEGRAVVEIASEGTLEERVERTLHAMRGGADVIYQGALLSRPWHGYSDFLLKVEGVASALGDYAYDVADTKLSRSAKPKHVIQLCVYADLVGQVQGVMPASLYVSLGDGVHPDEHAQSRAGRWNAAFRTGPQSRPKGWREGDPSPGGQGAGLRPASRRPSGRRTRLLAGERVEVRCASAS